MLLHAQEGKPTKFINFQDKEALQSQTNALSEELAECKSRMESLESRIKSCIAEKAPTKEHNKLYYDELKKAKGEIDVIVKEFTDYKLKYEVRI